MRMAALVLLALVAPARADEAPVCATEPEGRREAQYLHRYREASTPLQGPQMRSRHGPPDSETDGQVAILRDRGDLVAPRNAFDLDRAGLRFVPRGGGYALARVGAAVPPVSTPLALAGGGAVEVALPFSFPFFGRAHRSVFVHADGHLTFERPDADGGAFGMRCFLDGPPRVGVLFTDLDPSRGGSVSAQAAGDGAVFVWSGLPGGGQINRNTFQATLRPDGQVEMAWSEVETREAIVGLAPGGGGGLVAADLSEAQPPAAEGALVERFSERAQLDLVSVARRFYGSWPDGVDQLVVYTTHSLNPLPGSLAFEINVSNTVGGIGVGTFDDSAQWASAGRLQSVVFMDAIDPYLAVDGFEVLAHEVAHRWLARLFFRKGGGGSGGELLGRGGSHWSFFLDTDASVMEGNDIEDLGGGRFRTIDIARGYSPLDLYAMGLRAPDEIAPFFYVEQADDFRPNRAYKASSAPEAGVSFTGIRREVRIDDVVAVMGVRDPPSSRAPRVLRQAWILVEDDAAPASVERRTAVNRIRVRFESYFAAATGGRGIVDTQLP